MGQKGSKKDDACEDKCKDAKPSKEPAKAASEQKQRKSVQFDAAAKEKKPAGPLPGIGVGSHHKEGWDIPDRYEVRKHVGSGSYGAVSEAKDLQSGHKCAIKKVDRVFEDLTDCKRILREISILSRLKHPNVVRLYDCVISLKQKPSNWTELYIVMELADSDLKRLCRTPVFLMEEHGRQVIYNLLVGVRYLHSTGVWHRDLKPANVLVNQDCGVRICDFGLSRAMGVTVDTDQFQLEEKDPDTPGEMPLVPHTERLKRNLTGHVVTRWYRAPELILLQKNYTAAIDIWSLGCIFAELLGMVEKNIASPKDRGPLFPGGSCAPLSPDRGRTSVANSKRDQLSMIFDVIGTPTEKEVAELEGDRPKRIVRSYGSRSAQDLSTRFKGSTPPALELLAGMLIFDAKKRWTIDSCLSCEFVSKLRVAGDDAPAPEVIKLDFEGEPLSEMTLRRHFHEVVAKVQKDLGTSSRDISL